MPKRETRYVLTEEAKEMPPIDDVDHSVLSALLSSRRQVYGETVSYIAYALDNQYSQREIKRSIAHLKRQGLIRTVHPSTIDYKVLERGY